MDFLSPNCLLCTNEGLYYSMKKGTNDTFQIIVLSMESNALPRGARFKKQVPRISVKLSKLLARTIRREMEALMSI